MFLKIGHRGAMGHAPENTLLSFAKAIELNCNGTELDIHLCKSGELIVIHDETIDRTTNGKGAVNDYSLSDLKKYKIDNIEKIPALTEVLDLINRKITVHIELKGTGTAGPLAKVIELYINEKSWSIDDFIVSSFNYDELKKIRRFDSKLKIGVLSENPDKKTIELAKNLDAFSLHPYYKEIDAEFVMLCHDAGLKVFPWTVNFPKDIEKTKNLGVDGIFTDFPERE